MNTARFEQLRKKELSKLFSKKEVSSVWRKIVREQLRKLDIKDLYDHYDFNYNIEERATAVRNDILNGTYRVSLPLIYRLEKKYGICRHIVIPQPIDALVLQVLAESIADQILKRQPSQNAFYSRDKHNVSKPHEAAEYGLSFKQQWKKLQKEIYKFNKEKELLIVTDLSNYYDSININELKKVFLGYVKANEVLVDILFQIIEDISWKPDYLPYIGRGLPTSNLEAIRLLAHSFLFEIDHVLKEKTGDCFTRWMDDIVIGVDDRKEAINVISSVSDMLKSRGMALNLSKTSIYNKEEAFYHFQIDRNQYLDSLEGIDRTSPNYRNETTTLSNNFKKHFKDQRPKYWDKITKRFITAFGRLRSPRLLNDIVRIYLSYPGLRPNLLIYLSTLGFGKKTATSVEKILSEIDIFDDISLYQLCNLLTTWEIPVSKPAKRFLENIEIRILDTSFKKRNPSDFYSVLWFKAKYNDADELYRFVVKYKNIWQSDAFLRRQVTAALGRLLYSGEESVKVLLFSQISSGVIDTVSLANQIMNFSAIEAIDKKLRYYLFPTKQQKIYPLPKFLVLCSVLNSEKIRTNLYVIDKVNKYVKDPYYRKWLTKYYKIRFS